jgi:hypothetical protein
VHERDVPVPVTRRVVAVPALFALALALSAAACSSSDDSTFKPGTADGGGGDGGCGFGCTDPDGEKACVGLECQQVKCEPGARTTVSGTVFDPAGKVPIYNATVYVPTTKGALPAIPDGATKCDRCDGAVVGRPVVITTTDTSGRFRLENVPVGDGIPIVIQAGKWRRRIDVPTIPRCVDTPLDATLSRLPKNRSEGNVPRIALTTGGAEALQCLLRKIGVEDTEFGLAGSDARIHLYAGGGYVQGGPKPAASAFGNAATLSVEARGKSFDTAESLWTSLANLQKYDLVLMACEGDENENTPGAAKPDSAKNAIYDYAKGGGRVFAAHYHEVWFRKSPDAALRGVASWADPEQPPPGTPPAPVLADVSASFPKAVAMKAWLKGQGALTGDQLPIVDARHNLNAANAGALDWISLANPRSMPTPNAHAVQYMTFNTPIGAPEAEVCGRVMFSNVHVASGPQDGKLDDPQATFPDGCLTTELSPQQKALVFMLLDLSSCVQKDDNPIVVPK